MAMCLLTLCFETAPDDVGGDTARMDEAEALRTDISFRRDLRIAGNSVPTSGLLADLQALMNLLSSEFGWVRNRMCTGSA